MSTHGRRRRRLAAGLLAGLAGLMAGPAVAAEPADSAGTATEADSTSALDDYLRGLESRTFRSFPADEFSVSQGEIDSLLAAWESTGEAPYEAPEPRWDFDAGIAGLRYNRVEGLNVLPQASLRSPRGRLLLFAKGGYGWASREPAWRGGVRAGPLTLSRSRDVYSYGSGGVPGNSFTAITAGRDYHDYYRAEGWSAALDGRVRGVGVAVGWSDQDHESLPNEATFTLFEGSDAFRANPAIDDGSVRSVYLALSGGHATEGALAGTFSAAIAGGGLGGDFDFDRFRGEVVTRRRLWLGDELKVRIVGGVVTGAVPFQSLHHVGGTKTLRGYEINEIPARKFAHVALDYKMGTDLLRYVPFVRHFRFQPIPFLDAAGIFETQARDGTAVDPADPLWRFSAGVGVQYNALGIPEGAGQVRLEIARRLDRDDDTMTYRLGFTVER